MNDSPVPTAPLPGVLSLGYSLAGRVVEVGADVPDISPGDLVACAGSQDAHHAETVAVSRNLVSRIPEGVEPEEAAFVTLGSVAVEAIRRTGCSFGESVAIFGLGLLGLIGAQVAQRAGLTVIGIEPVETRRNVATAKGVGLAVDSNSPGLGELISDATEGFGVDASVLTLVSDSSQPVNQALRLTRRGGRVVGVGVYGMTLERDAVFDRTYMHAIAFGAGRYDPWYEEGNVDYPIQHVRWTENRTMAYFLRLLSDGAVDVVGMAESFPVDQAESAYARLRDSDRPYTIRFDY